MTDIEAIKKRLAHLVQKRDGLSGIGINNPDLNNTIIDITALLAEREWISVKDRLPEIGEEVLCYCPHKIEAGRNPVTALVRLIPYEGAREYYWDNYYGGNNTHVMKAVTHWQPLPPPPTGE